MFKNGILFFIFFTHSFPLVGYSQNSSIDSLIVHPFNSKVNAKTLYKISFISSGNIPSDAQFVFIFQDEFDLSQLNLAGSNKIDGGFTILTEDHRVIVRRRGEGHLVEQRTEVDLLLSIIKNPNVVRPIYLLQFQILDNQGVLITNNKTIPLIIEP